MSRKTTDAKLKNIEAKLTNISKYNHDTRKKNKNYLDKYISSRTSSNKVYVQDRVIHAKGLVEKINLLDADEVDNSRHAGVARETSLQHARNQALMTRKAARMKEYQVTPVESDENDSVGEANEKEALSLTSPIENEILFELSPGGEPLYVSPEEPKLDKKKGIAFLPRVKVPHFIKPIENIKKPEFTKEDIQEIIKKKREEHDSCLRNCKLIADEIQMYTSQHIDETADKIGFSSDAKLIDLLVHRILDPSLEWKEHIDFLISIPDGIKTKSPLKGGSYFEALFHLLFAINYYPQFKDKSLTFMEFKKYTELQEFKGSYLYDQSIQSAGGGSDIQGISDVTFRLNTAASPGATKYTCGERYTEVVDETNPVYYFSIKRFQKEKTIAKHYDIPILSQQAGVTSKKYPHARLCVGVKNKQDFIAHLARTRISFLKNTLSLIIGYDELISYFEEFRRMFFKKFGLVESAEKRRKYIEQLYPISEPVKQPLQLYYHQELVASSVIQSISKIDLKALSKPYYVCIGVLPRGGKSYIAGAIMDMYKTDKKKKTGFNVLFLTSAVTETISQFKEDLIEKFSEFRDYKFVDARSEEPGPDNNFVFISRQLASIKDEGDETGTKVSEMIDVLKAKHINLHYDLIFFDEAHIGVLSKIQQDNLISAFSKFNVPIILMTATYIKPSNLLEDKKDLFVWDLFDIQEMRKLPELGLEGFKKFELVKRFGKEAVDILEKRLVADESLEKIAAPYKNFPQPVFISPTFSEETIKKIQSFEYNKFFEMDEKALKTTDFEDVKQWSEWWKCLKYRDQALMLRNYLTLKDNELIKTDKDKAFAQIFKKAESEGTRPLLGQPFSVLMFMPEIANNPVGHLCRVWGSFLMQTPFWRDNFVVLTLSPLVKTKKKKGTREPVDELTCIKNGFCVREIVSSADLKEKILKVERDALKEGKGLLMLSGQVAKMGISLPCTDVVLLMSNNEDSADDIIQKMFRALTDSPGKKYGFVVDINIKRIVRALFEYDVGKEYAKMDVTKSTDERLDSIFELCDWGYDNFIENKSKSKEDNIDFEKIMADIKDRIFSNLDLYNVSKKEIEQKAFEILISDEDLKKKFAAILRKGDKPKGKPEVLGEKGKSIPGKATKEKEPVNEEGGDLSDAGTAVGDTGDNGEEEIPIETVETSFKAMTITFINSLIMRSNVNWDLIVRIDDLLRTFEADRTKSSGSPDCLCNKKSECDSKHDNLYERVYCDIQSYIKDKRNTIKTIDLLYDFIVKRRDLKGMLQVYLETFMKNIEEKSRRGLVGGRRKTLKKRRVN